MRPNAENYNPDPQYFSDLVRSSGLSTKKLGRLIGHDGRTIRRWMSGERKFSYPVQFAVECVVLVPE